MSDHHDQPLTALWMAMSGASAGDHHEDPPGLADKSVAVGHEPDKFNVRGIVYVPAVVVITLLVTYFIVQSVMSFVVPDSPERASFNDRVAVISSTDPKPLVDEKTESANKSIQAPIPQPRLEYIRQVENDRPGHANDPVYLRSFQPRDNSNNSPEFYPEDLHSDRYTDQNTGRKPLAEYDWKKGKELAQIPISEAMTLLTTTLKEKRLPSAKGSNSPFNGTSNEKSKLSNGGVGGPAMPKEAKAHDHHHDHDKH